ncbi:MAG: beta-lactamase family protein [Henriciella sp.]|nr:beta-lactamase family protein [Henriciella sp.]
MQSYVDQNIITNLSFGVWQDGQLITEGNYGPISETISAPVSDTTIYRIRSMTKPVTAIGLLILMERGHFKLSDPITKFLPEFEENEVLADYDSDGVLYTYPWLYSPTMEQLLAHTAGFAYDRTNSGVIDQKLNESGISDSPDTDEFVRTLASFPYVSMPGAEWNYSFASDLQGAIIERITGQSLAEFLKKEVFDPLHMSDTGFYVAPRESVRISGVGRLFQGEFKYIELEASDFTAQSRVYFEGGHGLYSTRSDYFKFLNMLRKGGRVGDHQIISSETSDRFQRNAIQYRGGHGRQRSYGGGAGLGFGLGIGTIEEPELAQLPAPKGTMYWTGALGTWFWIDPVNDIVFIGMTQSDGAVEPNMMKGSMITIYGDPNSLNAEMR